MRHLIFSPLAIICALSALYPPQDLKTQEFEWADSFEEIDEESEDLFSLLELDEEQLEEQLAPPEIKIAIQEDLLDEESGVLAYSEEDDDDEESDDGNDKDEDDADTEDDGEEEGSAPEALDSDEEDEEDDGEDTLSFAPAEKKESVAAPNYPRPRAPRDVAASELPMQTQKPASTRAAVRTPIPTSSVGIGASYSYIHFTPTGESAFHGNLAGAQGLFEYRPTCGFYSALKTNWREGITHSANHVNRHVTDVLAEERIGFTSHSGNRLWHLSVFSGIGFHYSNQKLTQPGASAMRFIYNQFYCPLGFFSDYRFFHWFSVGLTGVWMPQVFPTLSISPLGGARWETKLGLKNFLVEVPLTFYVGGKTQFFFSVKPSFQFWQDGKTTAKTTTGLTLGVPKNTYYFVGFEANLGCAF